MGIADLRAKLFCHIKKQPLSWTIGLVFALIFIYLIFIRDLIPSQMPQVTWTLSTMDDGTLAAHMTNNGVILHNVHIELHRQGKAEWLLAEKTLPEVSNSAVITFTKADAWDIQIGDTLWVSASGYVTGCTGIISRNAPVKAK